MCNDSSANFHALKFSSFSPECCISSFFLEIRCRFYNHSRRQWLSPAWPLGYGWRQMSTYYEVWTRSQKLSQIGICRMQLYFLLWLSLSVLLFSLLSSCSSLCGREQYAVEVFCTDTLTEDAVQETIVPTTGFVQYAVADTHTRLPTLCTIAGSLSGCEKRGNRGYWPDRWNTSVGSPLGSPYCAAAISFLLDSVQARAPTVRSGLARSFKTHNSFSALDVIMGKRSVKAGTLIGWNLGRTSRGHIGIAMAVWSGTGGSSWQANSTFARCGGSGTQRDGGGWGIKRARIEPYAYLRIAWFTPTQ